MHIIEKDAKHLKENSSKTGFSIGKVNYCLKALIDIGFIKIITLIIKQKIKLCIYFNAEGYSRKNSYN